MFAKRALVPRGKEPRGSEVIMDQQRKMKVVYTIVDRGQKSYWVRVGVGFENADGSLNLKLDAVPTNGTLQVREWEPREDRDLGGRDGRERERDGRSHGAGDAAARFA